MHVHRFRPPYGDNYQYAVVADGRALLVDPFDGKHALRELASAVGATPAGILITHTHWDHTQGVAELLEAHAGLPVYAHKDSLDELPGDEKVGVADGSTIAFAGGEIEVLETPGHHPAHLTYRTDDTLLVGDVLFLAGCGNPNFGGDVDVLFEVVWERLRPLPDALRLAWGHDYADKNLRFALDVEPEHAALRALAEQVRACREAGQELPWRTLGEERATNPFLRCDEAALQAVVGADHAHAAFVALRGRRDRF